MNHMTQHDHQQMTELHNGHHMAGKNAGHDQPSSAIAEEGF